MDDSAAGPSATDASSQPGPRHVIVLVGSITGEGSWRGLPARRGVETALSELKRGSGPPLRLEVLDDRGDHHRASRLVRRAAADSDVAGILFAGPPRALPRVEGALKESGTAAFLLYGDLGGFEGPHPQIFQMGPSFSWEASALVGRALRRPGAALGALTEDSELGERARATISNALEERGASLVHSEVFSPVRLDRLGHHLRRLRDGGARQLLVEASPKEFGLITAALREMSWGPRLLGFDLTLTPPYRGPVAPPGSLAAEMRTRTAHLEGGPELEAFVSASRRTTGELPLWWEHRAYAATLLVAWSAERAASEDDPARTLEELQGESFTGLDVVFSERDHLAPNRADLVLFERVRGSHSETQVPRNFRWLPLGE
ncbi:MAG: ABC transporter substrate-binding protein [Actinomycetota bacterium]|nr:ABC transporter substrate-binding protein [Actinomycetota bacterium]